MSHLSTYSIPVCSLGVYGTRYIRDGQAIASTLSFNQGESQTLSLAHITSEFPIGTTLAINLRQSTALEFVTLTEQSGSTDVIIDTTGVAAGDYTLTLESFNTLSLAKSALKTDTMTISVLVQPSFAETLSLEVVTAGTAATWKLPEIVDGDYLANVQVVPPSSLDSYITYDSATRQISFSDDDSSKSLSGSSFNINIILVNTNGDESIYEQTVLVHSPPSSPSFTEELQVQVS